MTWAIHQHWDPLQVCVVGRSYPPEFYSWITKPRVRNLFEKIAEETEQDYQAIVQKLESFGIEVLRPNLPQQPFVDGRYVKPPMSPRDYMAMIGGTFYFNEYYTYPADIVQMYNNVRDSTWPDCKSWAEFEQLPTQIKNECTTLHQFDQYRTTVDPLHLQGCYDHILDRIRAQGNQIKYNVHDLINGAQVTQLGRDLFFGNDSYERNWNQYQQLLDQEFSHTRNHIVNSQGHSDGVYCAVAPGLIITSPYLDDYSTLYPGWEVVRLSQMNQTLLNQYTTLKTRNQGRWWIPGFEHDDDLINLVESNLQHWTGNVEETIFDVNMLIIDPKNVLMFTHNQQIVSALDQFGITVHVVPFRHKFFWDGGVHCFTSDLHRSGVPQNYFTESTQ